MWQDVRDPATNKLLFRFDPARDLVQVGSRGVYHLVDLTEYRQPQPQPTYPQQKNQDD